MTVRYTWASKYYPADVCLSNTTAEGWGQTVTESGPQ
jgi:hypothetical protein